MTNPYGTDRGPQPQGQGDPARAPGQPQGLGDPGNHGPQFLAPGAYGGQPQPGAYGQQPGAYGHQPGGFPGQSPYSRPPGPYGERPPYSPQPGPYGEQPPYSQSPYRPGPSPSYPSGPQAYYGVPPQPGVPPARPPRTRRPTGLLVVLVVVAVLTGVVYGGWRLYRGTVGTTPVTQATPTRPTRTLSAAPSVARSTLPPSAATRGSTDCVSGDRITTDAFVATVPASWSCDGDDGDVSITSTRSDAIWVQHDAGSGDLAGDCKAQLEGLGDVTPLPSETWGGRTALAFQAVDSGDIFGVRCVTVGSQSWYLMYFPLDAGDDASVRGDVTTLLRTWVWR